MNTAAKRVRVGPIIAVSPACLFGQLFRSAQHEHSRSVSNLSARAWQVFLRDGQVY